MPKDLWSDFDRGIGPGKEVTYLDETFEVPASIQESPKTRAPHSTKALDIRDDQWKEKDAWACTEGRKVTIGRDKRCSKFTNNLRQRSS